MEHPSSDIAVSAMVGFQVSEGMYCYGYDHDTTRLKTTILVPMKYFCYEIFKNNGKITTQDSSKTIIMKKYTLHNNSKCFSINIYAQKKRTLADKNMRVMPMMPSKPMKELLKGYKSVDLFQKLGNATLIPNSIKLPNGMENCLL
jgi:hypothetical protein